MKYQIGDVVVLKKDLYCRNLGRCPERCTVVKLEGEHNGTYTIKVENIGNKLYFDKCWIKEKNIERKANDREKFLYKLYGPDILKE